MARCKHPLFRGGTQNAGTRSGVSPGGGSPYILDKLLVPRVLAHAKYNSLSDVDAVASALRQTHREYQRRPQAAFRQMVAKAIQAVQSRGGASEDQQGSDSPSSSGSGGTSSGKSNNSSSSSTSQGGSDGDTSSSSPSGSQSDRKDGRKGPHDRGGANNMLLSMYARTPQAEGDADGAGPGPGSTSTGAGASRAETRRKRARSPTAPFASPEVIAAAAAAAAAAAQVEKKAKTQLPAAAEPAAAAIAAFTSSGALMGAADTVAATATAAGAAAGVTGKAVPTPSASGGAAGKRGASGRAEGGGQPSTVKKARRGGAGGGGGGGSSAVVSARPVTYEDLGGVEEVLADIRELIEYPLKHPEVYAWLGVEPPRGVLLHGPPGCGKTALANAIANECGVPFLRVSAPEIVSGMSGESEAKLRGLFQEASELAPCIVFIDEIDAIAPKRETAQREMERRIVAQMLTCMDDLASSLAGPETTTTNQPPTQADTTTLAGAGATPLQPMGRPHVVVIGATNRPDALDPALRRAGRFDREITLGIPTEAARAKILRVITRRLRLEGDFDFFKVAKKTPGFVGADLMALVKEAAALAVTRIFSTLGQCEQKSDKQPTTEDVDMVDATAHGLQDVSTTAAAAKSNNSGDADIQGAQQVAVVADTTADITADTTAGKTALLGKSSHGGFGTGPLGPAELAGLAISMSDFEVAVSKVQPSVRREGFTTTPDVTWEDVGSLDEVREELSFSITQPVMHPEQFEALGMTTAMGVLLYGPPGCGKTLVAKAVASESGANFISIKGPELLNKYVGESERAVRQLFSRARAAQPCVLFFDELDALAPRRGTDTNQAAERVVNQLLTEMDGVDGRQGVFVVAATNRPDMIDPALLRPGRLGKVLFVPLPPPDGRVAILKALVRRTPLSPDVDISLLGNSDRCNGFSGADLAALVREASVMALKESLKAVVAGTASTSAAPSPPSTGVDVAKPVVRVCMRHFESALSRMSPSVSKKDARGYEALRKSLRGNLRSRLEGDDTTVEILASLPPPSSSSQLPILGNVGGAPARDLPNEEGGDGGHGATAKLNPDNMTVV